MEETKNECRIKMYLVLQNDTPIFAIEKNDVKSVSNAMVNHFNDKYLTVDKIYPDGELSFFEYVEVEFKIIEIKLYSKESEVKDAKP